MALLDLTEKAHGNANGIGLADFLSRRLYEKIDLAQTYPNALTTTTVNTVKIPMVLDTDKMVVKAAIKTCNAHDFTKARVAFIKNTKKLDTIYVSENMAEEALQKGMKVAGEPFEIPFDEHGALMLEYE